MFPFGRVVGLLLVGCTTTPTSAGPSSIPDDPDFAKQWALQNTGQLVNGTTGTPGADIRATAAWEIYAGSSSIVVAIVGTGVDPHIEFADRLLEGYVSPSTGGDPFSTLETNSASPGTRVAGIIGASTNNRIGIAGVNGNAWLLPVRVIQGTVGTETSTAEGIEWAVDNGARIIVVPLQFYDGIPRLASAVAYAAAHDVVVVAPAGHAANNEIAFPAAFDGCIAVSSTTNSDALATFSNFGEQVDLAAPGKDIWSTRAGDAYGFETASSSAYAAAYVAGVASLMRSYAPQLSAEEVKEILIASAHDLGVSGWDPYFGAGRLDALRALELTPPPAIRFEHVDPIPKTIPPDRPSSFTVRIADGEQQVLPESAMLMYRTAAAGFAEPTPLRFMGDGLYAVDLPSVPCETTIEYYFLAAGNDGTFVTDPLDAPASLHTVLSIQYQTLFDDDFETDLGWEVDGGTSTTGRWTRVIPVGTSAQPAFDRSTDYGRYCFITGQHPPGGGDGANDVDGGPVRLISPVIPLPLPDAEITYARWFYTTTGTPDQLTVEISRNGGASWVVVESVGNTGGWTTHSFLLSEIPQAVGDQLRIRFSTSDIPSDSLTEAALDEFRVQAIDCTVMPGDADGDRDVDLDDYRRFRECWKGPLTSPGDPSCAIFDLTPDGYVDLKDFQEFQKSFHP